MRHQDLNIIFQLPKETTSGFVIIKKCHFKSRSSGTFPPWAVVKHSIYIRKGEIRNGVVHVTLHLQWNLKNDPLFTLTRSSCVSSGNRHFITRLFCESLRGIKARPEAKKANVTLNEKYSIIQYNNCTHCLLY